MGSCCQQKNLVCRLNLLHKEIDCTDSVIFKNKALFKISDGIQYNNYSIDCKNKDGGPLSMGQQKMDAK